MNGRTLLLGMVVLVSAIATTGCSNGQPRFKGIDAYNNATETNQYGPVPGVDPYSYGGTAYATGGLAPAAMYGTGALGAFDGDPNHFAAIIQYNGDTVPPVDWGGGKNYTDTSGIVPQVAKPDGE